MVNLEFLQEALKPENNRRAFTCPAIEQGNYTAKYRFNNGLLEWLSDPFGHWANSTINFNYFFLIFKDWRWVDTECNPTEAVDESLKKSCICIRCRESFSFRSDEHKCDKTEAPSDIKNLSATVDRILLDVNRLRDNEGYIVNKVHSLLRTTDELKEREKEQAKINVELLERMDKLERLEKNLRRDVTSALGSVSRLEQQMSKWFILD